MEQNVPLNNLKTVLSSCYFDESLKYAAVLSKVVDSELKRLLKGNYLLEVWTEGQLLF